MPKVCRDCGETKESSEFYKDSSKKDGLQSYCKVCKSEWSRDNSLAMRSYRKKYWLNNREKHVNYTKRYRNTRKFSVGTYTQEEWELVVMLHGGRCAACGIRCELTVDHIVPVSLGGRGDITNIQPLCRRCNSRKGNRHCADYRICASLEVIE